MSRSFKKNPICKDNQDSSKERKQMANRTLRRKLNDPNYEIGNGNEYQKHYESWEIHDYVSRWSLNDALKMYREPNHSNCYNYWKKKYATEEEFIRAWRKEMLRK